MRVQYIRQVKRNLHLSYKEKLEVVRDLEEIFFSAAEHGEGEAQVIERLGTAKEFADSISEQFGVDNAVRKKRKVAISCVMAFLVALAAFTICAVIQMGKVPDGAIGHADAMTNIRLESAFAFSAFQTIFAIGSIALVFASIQVIRTISQRRR